MHAIQSADSLRRMMQGPHKTIEEQGWDTGDNADDGEGYAKVLRIRGQA